jgi:hypothetical protein
MTQDEIIELAKQAGFAEKDAMFRSVYLANIKDLEAFAKLIAEKEREACAKLLETTDLGGLKDNPAMQSWVAEMLLAYVNAIRARGQA